MKRPFVHIQAELGNKNIQRKVKWIRRHCSPAETYGSRCQRRGYDGEHVTPQAWRPPTIFNIHEWAGKKHPFALKQRIPQPGGGGGGGSPLTLAVKSVVVTTTSNQTPPAVKLYLKLYWLDQFNHAQLRNRWIIFVYTMETNFFSIWNHYQCLIVRSFRFICIPMLWVYAHYKYLLLQRGDRP